MPDMTATPPQQESGDFGQALGSLLRRYLEGARAAVSHLPGGPRGFQVLSISAAGACSNQATIADRLGLDRTVMTYLVDDLEKAGLVERRPDPADRRARQVVMTAKGTKVLAASTESVRDVERDVLGSLNASDAELFRELLGRVAGPGVTEHTDCEAPPDC